ncbi:MAG TPA: polyprenol monophosphomannose synthase [Saprospiraceae bacterium]|nr:polyprenol monophosphomannose synthase [Saprospiraceae bacterium]
MPLNLVIIPTYNEKENIEKILKAVIAQSDDFDVLIVDDNSSDGTADIVKKMQTIYPDRIILIQRAGKLGLGTAYIEGFKFGLEHNYSFVYEMDADFSYNPADLQRMYEVLKSGQADVVVGSRYVKGGSVVNWPFDRRAISYGGSLYTRLITWMPVKDPTAGFIGYNAKVLAAIDLQKIQFVGYAFQIQMKFEAWSLGFVIKEIPIVFKDREEGVSKMSGSIVKEAAFGVLGMKIRKLFSRFS